ncbi:MAG TPA: sigma-70 family RNA polymerase sigma factor [Thermoanaerobaculia bacterium]|nr:sigma-70 family RNA polymerase sigma factor [Thermoanaerobaculia bacterium]
MTSFNDSAPPKRTDGDIEQIYLAHYDFLVSIAVRKFRVPLSEAETLVHEVFLCYLKRKGEIHDVHSWLLGGICHASRYWWRQHGRAGETVELETLFDREDPTSHDIRNELPDALTMRAVLESLPPRYRLVLRLRYYDGCSIAEIAKSLGVKPKYAQKLVSKCIKKAEKTYHSKGRTACPPAERKPDSRSSWKPPSA